MNPPSKFAWAQSPSTVPGSPADWGIIPPRVAHSVNSDHGIFPLMAHLPHRHACTRLLDSASFHIESANMKQSI